MEKFFDYHYEGPAFALFGAGHLLALGIIAIIVIFLVWGWRAPDDEMKRRVRLLLAGIILATESSWHAWNLVGDTWSIQKDLPLHICSIGIWCSIYMLATRSYRVYEILFFVGLAGSTQALLTPNLGIYGLPHFWAVQSLASHGLLVIAMIYMTAIEGFRPTWQSVWKTMLALNVYFLFVAGINYVIDSNYMYTMAKPETASLLDLMGPWPWYIAVCEFVALGLFALLYAPFALSDRRRRTG